MAKPFYGWVVVGVATLAIFFSGPGQTYSISMFVDPLIAEFGWSRSLISTLYSAGTLTAGLSMTLIGRLVDQRGYRSMLTLIVLLFAAACLYMSTINGALMLFGGFFLIRALGQGSLTLIPYSLVPQWFVTRRGRALSIVGIGALVSGAVFPYVDVLAISAYGWRATWQLWAACLALVMAPTAWWLTRDRPEDLGLRPDGGPNARVRPLAGAKAAAAVEHAAAIDDSDEVVWTVQQALRSRVFWVIVLCTSVPPMVGTGLMFHHTSILGSNGLSAAVAAGVFTVSSLVALPGTLAAGYVCDRWPIRYVLSASLLVHALGGLWLFMTFTPGAAAVLGVLRGLSMAFFQVALGVVYPQYFGRRYLASIRGVTTTAMVIASALGPMPVGVAYDWFGGYAEAITAMAVLPVLAAVAILFLDPPGSIP